MFRRVRNVLHLPNYPLTVHTVPALSLSDLGNPVSLLLPHSFASGTTGAVNQWFPLGTPQTTNLLPTESDHLCPLHSSRCLRSYKYSKTSLHIARY
uniref:Uncharacterized protein n=1 Tax=Anguilla anguilla TaxID=7936 RepID=A0A0E9XNU3_ANGAN